MSRILLAWTIAVIGVACSSNSVPSKGFSFATGVPTRAEFQVAWNKGKHESLQIPSNGWERHGDVSIAFIRNGNLIVGYEERTGAVKLSRGQFASVEEFVMTYAALVDLYLPADVSDDAERDMIGEALSGQVRPSRNGFELSCIINFCVVRPPEPAKVAVAAPTRTAIPAAIPAAASAPAVEVAEGAESDAASADAAAEAAAAAEAQPGTEDVIVVHGGTSPAKEAAEEAVNTAEEAAHAESARVAAAEASRLREEERQRWAKEQRLSDLRFQQEQERERLEIQKSREAGEALKRLQDQRAAELDAEDPISK